MKNMNTEQMLQKYMSLKIKLAKEGFLNQDETSFVNYMGQEVLNPKNSVTFNQKNNLHTVVAASILKNI